ncbi:hypothetical protein [Flavobacterium rhamnosiphilum]|nr:hypothetical protein [Flavobacterium rhamnosiphilum]
MSPVGTVHFVGTEFILLVEKENVNCSGIHSDVDENKNIDAMHKPA